MLLEVIFGGLPHVDDVRVDIGEVVDTVGKVESCLVLYFSLLQFVSDII